MMGACCGPLDGLGDRIGRFAAGESGPSTRQARRPQRGGPSVSSNTSRPSGREQKSQNPLPSGFAIGLSGPSAASESSGREQKSRNPLPSGFDGCEAAAPSTGSGSGGILARGQRI